MNTNQRSCDTARAVAAIRIWISEDRRRLVFHCAFVFGGIVVELKAVSELLPEHEAQLFNYMRVSRIAVGYLVNFGHKGDLQWKRFILSDLHEKPVPAMPAAGRLEGRNTNQERNTNQL